MLCRNRRGHRADPRIDGKAQLLRDQAAQFRHQMLLRGQLDEGQRLRGPKMDRVAALGTERLTVENQVRALAMNGDLVHFLEVDAAIFLPL